MGLPDVVNDPRNNILQADIHRLYKAWGVDGIFSVGRSWLDIASPAIRHVVARLTDAVKVETVILGHNRDVSGRIVVFSWGN